VRKLLLDLSLEDGEVDRRLLADDLGRMVVAFDPDR
jgi:hypothetical protein